MEGLSDSLTDFFEASDCFTERFAQFGELAWTENHQGNYKNDDQLGHTKTSEHTPPPDAITLCFGVRDVNLMAGAFTFSKLCGFSPKDLLSEGGG
jgi:hypothetical protein